MIRPVIGILRGFDLPAIPHIVEAATRGGLEYLEVTMNSNSAENQIREAIQRAQGKLKVGAGTVLNLPTLRLALKAGAQFIVTPTVRPDVIEECVRLGIPVFPGAFSPTEVVQAWDLGAAMVKIFPADILGPACIKALKTPLPHIKLLPTGGVDLQTLPGYIRAGADGFGVGSPLFDRARIESADWNWLESQCRSFVTAAAST